MSLLAAGACAAVAQTNAQTAVRRIADMPAAFAAAGGNAEVPFDFTVKVTLPGIPRRHSFVAEDESEARWFGINPAISDSCPTNAGDVLRVRGVAIPSVKTTYNFDCRQIELVRHGRPVEAKPVSWEDVYASTNMANRLVQLEGVVFDTFRDEIDPQWSLIVLDCGGGIVYCAICDEAASETALEELIGARVSFVGILRTLPTGNRKMIDRLVYSHGMPYVKVLSAARADPFAAPELSKTVRPRPLSAPRATGWRRATGHVVAVWDGGTRLLLKAGDGRLLRTELRSRPAPSCGERVEVAGLPETDLYRVNLSRAVWRKVPGGRFEGEPAQDVSISQLVSYAMGVRFKNAELHGRVVRLRGTVRGLPVVGRERGRMYLEEGAELIPVDASACPEALANVEVGCKVEVTGTFVTETENWRTNRVLPQIREVLVAVRTPADVRVVARPPFWTTGRWLALVGALLAAICVAFVWNALLRRRAELRGKELAAEQMEHAASKLKVFERTRLASDLHDAISQMLMGASMELDSAQDLASGADDALRRQLVLASKMVSSCRTELRNCLWDLRSQALEAEDMDKAIRLSLGQVMDRAKVAVRFNVARSRISDSTTHAILLIVRELASNAVSHGRAASVKIAGSIEGGKLMFSVRDDGCGFDPSAVPGVAEGHFGLQGIVERVERMGGEVEVDSAPGRGAKITVSIDVPADEPEKGDCNGR